MQSIIVLRVLKETEPMACERIEREGRHIHIWGKEERLEDIEEA